MKITLQRLALLFLLSVSGFSQAQDTLKVMHYNLLNYGNSTTYCTSSNNNIANKDNYLKTITEYVAPHIFTVNEMGASVTYADRILVNALNVNGASWYKRAAYSNNGFSDLVNMLFYDSRVLELHGQEEVSKNLGGADLARVINIYKLYYKSPGLALGDTIFLHVIVAHLKAGSASADQTQRADETAALVNYLNGKMLSGNYIMCGDFNTGSSSEAAYQNLTQNPDLRFRLHDPINMPGSWNNNGSFASIHTQSTHTTSGCHSSGGMDDRFDFILASSQVMQDSMDVKYLTGSYQAVGQDGARFNQTVSSPANNSAPSDVINALYGMSDHLPVTIKLRVNAQPVSVPEALANRLVSFNNPAENELTLTLEGFPDGQGYVRIFDLSGREIFVQHIRHAGDVKFTATYDLPFPSGMYILHISGSTYQVSRKLIIK